MSKPSSPLPDWLLPDSVPDPEAAFRAAVRKVSKHRIHQLAPLGDITVGDVANTAAGVVPGVGESQDIDAFVEARRNKDVTGQALSALGLAIPLGVTGASLATLLRLGKSPRAAGVPLKQAGMVGARFDKGPQARLAGTRAFGGEISDKASHTDWDVINELFQPRSRNQSVRLRDVLNHPELYKVYPELQGIKVVGVPGRGEGAAIVRSADTGEILQIEIHPNRVGPNDLLHEVQHAIQAHDGRLTLEADPERFSQYMIQGVEREPNLTTARMDLSQADLEQIPRLDDQKAQVAILRGILPHYRAVEKRAKRGLFTRKEEGEFNALIKASVLPERELLEAAKPKK